MHQDFNHISHQLQTVVFNSRFAQIAGWYPQQESNLYLTLRRHVHYPLCYEGNSLLKEDFSRMTKSGAHSGEANLANISAPVISCVRLAKV